MPNFRQRQWLLAAMAIAVIIVLTLIAAPNSNGSKNNSGSSYGRTPDGYGAWYEYMSKKEIPIKRSQKPFAQFIKDNNQGVTYIKIHSKADFLSSTLDLSKHESSWVEKGNTLVILGVNLPATAAPFKSFIPYRDRPLSSRQIEIETTRRYIFPSKNTSLLSDRYGAIVWSKTLGKGKVIYSTTPYLAANAYQDSADNYEFLAELVSQNRAIWIDEYIHGYKDREIIVKEQRENVLSYLAKTPLYLLFIQMIVIGSVASAAAFRRFGVPIVSKTALVDNSTAYIDALAGVLEKANSTDFIIDTIAKDEQRKLQTSLGLGKCLVDDKTLINTCQQQKKESVADLRQLLQTRNANHKISDAKLITWIQKWQKINSQ